MDKEKKSLAERWDEDILSDNSQTEYCKLCKDCIFRDGGTPFSNHYTKSSCMMYQHPKMKPLRVINNTGLCEYYNNGEDAE